MASVLFRIVVCFLLLLTTSKTYSQAIVRNIQNWSEILVDKNGIEGFYYGKTVVILAKEEEKIVAIGRITDSELANQPGVGKVRIDEIVDNFMIMPGDKVEILNFKLYKEKKIPGFFSITLKGSQKIPAQFKELAYFGVFTSEGHTLDQKEVLISPFQFQYGVTDEINLKVVNALWFDGYANLGAKVQVLRNKKAKITINSFGAFKVTDQDWIGQFGGVVTLPSNSKFQSHLMLNITFDPMYEDSKATKGLGLFQDSDIRGITEYITDNWNRLLYGPVYNVELQTLGGTVSHMWIWNTFHMSLGMATKDFSNLTFGRKGYYYVYDIFWRF